MGRTTVAKEWNVLISVLLLFVVSVGGQDEPIINKGAIVGKPLVLPCGLPQAKRAPPVTWVDFVHNTDEDPITIFDGSAVVASHPKADRYSVGSDYSLTIANVSETDPGEYVCRSKVGRTVNSASYIVLVADLPQCAGETSLAEGDDLLLTCTTSYWGSEQPDVRWYRGDEAVTDIIDRSVISEAQYMVDTRARWQDDKLSYQCRVSVDGLAAHCEKVLSVTYTVRNIQVGPVDSASVPAGEYVTCSAKGNPEPQVTLTLKSLGLTQTGSGTQRLLVADSWVGKNLTFDCEARNTVPGKDETVVAYSVTLYMRDKTNTPLPTTKRAPPPKSAHSVTQPAPDLKAASAAAGDSMYGIVIGIAIGVLAIIVIIVAVICLRRRKQQDKRTAGGKTAAKGGDSRKMEDGRSRPEEKQPLTANHEPNASVSVNGDKARYSPTKA